MAAIPRRFAVFLAGLTLAAAGLACGERDLPPAATPALPPLAATALPPANAVPNRPARPPTPPANIHPAPPLLPPATNPPAAGPRLRWVAPDPPPPSPGPPPAGYAELPKAAALSRQNPAAALAIQTLPWVADGLVAAERAAAAALVNLAIGPEPLLWDLLEKNWVNKVDHFPELAMALTALQQIAAIEPAAARRIAAMPFLKTLEPADVAALESLAQLAAADQETFRRTLAHPSLAGGIDNAAAKIMAVLAGVHRHQPALLNRLLNGEPVRLEERVIDLPQSGPTTLAILRLEPGNPGSMDLLETAVRFAADYIEEPLPSRYIALLFAAAVPDYSAGANFGTHIAVRPQYDRPAAGGVLTEGGLSQNGGRALAHEVAHYYWAGNAPWLDEGAAELLAALFVATQGGGNPQPNHYPCAGARGIRDLAAADYALDEPGYPCHYALGERLFLDLYRSLGAADFWEGFRRLYREISAGGGATGIAAVRRAFSGIDPAAQERVERIIDRWHNGADPADWRLPEDSTAAVADLPPINGRINRAYLALTPGGKPAHRFSATAAGDWAWLNLEYAYHFPGPPQELELEVVEYFEDGFAYRRMRDVVTLTAQGSGGWRRYSVGPGPGRPWAVGRHWVLVYHRGVKVAAVAYEVMG